MQKFHNDEVGYAEWMSANPNGFVFNHFAGNNPGMNVLHKASCRHLHRDKDDKVRTIYEKWCADSQEELTEYANQQRGQGQWKRCATCMGE